MVNNSNLIPAPLSDALRAFINLANEYSIPYYLALPIPFNPIIASSINSEQKDLAALEASANAIVFAYQYSCIGRVKYRPEVVGMLKDMYDIDPEFEKNARIGLLSQGYKEPAITELLQEVANVDNVDYSFANRLHSSNQTNL